MTKQIEVRPLMPHIYRAWDAPSGRMVWKCNEQSAGRWGLGISLGLKLDWRRARQWCHEQNAKVLIPSNSGLISSVPTGHTQEQQ